MASVQVEVLILFSAGAVPKHSRNFYVSLLQRKTRKLFTQVAQANPGD